MEHRWRRPVPDGEPFLLGRATHSFRVPWDARISREHARLQMIDHQLKVEKLPNASNPVFYQGKEAPAFVISPGDHFVIGTTSFTFIQESAHVSIDVPLPSHQKSFSSEFLKNLRFRNAEQRIEVLNRLPDVISSAANEQDLLNRISNTLLAGIPNASTVGFVRCVDPVSHSGAKPAFDPTESWYKKSVPIEILHWDRRGNQAGDFRPSEKLIRQAIYGERTMLHQWSSSERQRADFTFDMENDWAFACPIDGPATPGWGIYVAGSQRTPTPGSNWDSDADDLQGDIKFCQLVGSVLTNLFQVKQLERSQAGLRSFFSPIVMEALSGRDPDEVLAPKKCNVSVMFCDLRGFSKRSEDYGDELFQLLQRVSSSLDVVTREILRHGGVIGDFHGDAVMGFWGWPLPLDDNALRAVVAALSIEFGFRQIKPDETGFQIAIGIASGTAVAGKIGSQDQVKVTAFGPVVNLASRLEGLNRLLHSSMLIDRTTLDEFLRRHDESSAERQILFRWRSMGMFQPYGMNSATEVIQILTELNTIDEAELDAFNQAMTCFQQSNWEMCRQYLNQVPAEDNGRKFLEDEMKRHDQIPPAGWKGVVQVQSK